jgi:hypothetical protein
MNRQFSKEVQLPNIYVKEYPTSLAINEMQIKITLRFQHSQLHKQQQILAGM